MRPVAGSIVSDGGNPTALKVSGSPSASVATNCKPTGMFSACICATGVVRIGGCCCTYDRPLERLTVREEPV